MTTTQENPNSPIGKETRRIDGPLKVTGAAVYTSDYNFPGMLYAVPIGASIAKGKIASMDVQEAEKMPGVKAILHRANLGKLFRVAPNSDFSAYTDEDRPPFEDDTIRYYGQYVAVAVAETLEQATSAANAVKVTYNQEIPNVKAKLTADTKIEVQSERGDAKKAFEKAAPAARIDATYSTPAETHNVIELHATVAVFDDAKFTLYETTQGVTNHKNVLVQVLGVEPDKVQVISKYLGSGFGGKITPWPQSALAAAVARKLGKPIKLVITRKMAFHAAGHRPRTQQQVKMSATKEGKLTSLQHHYLNHTSILDDYTEHCSECTKYLYSCPNVLITGALSRRHVGTPTSMRGPGAVPGLFATESAIDELAVKLKIDPVQMRILNEPEKDEGLDVPFASRHLIECYKTGAEKFGWSKRNPQVGSMKKNGLTLGWGTAGASWIAERWPAQAIVELRNDGTAKVACGTQDIGTGTYTVLAQIVSDKIGIPLNKIEVVLGDTTLPPGPLSGGSMVTASLIPAVSQAAQKAIATILSAAEKTPGSPFAGIEAKNLAFTNGRIHKKDHSDASGNSGNSGKEAHFEAMPFGQFLKSCNFKMMSGTGSSPGTFGAEKAKQSVHSYGAHFVEVTWQDEIARLRVNRVVTVIDAGKIINPKAARNQIEGAVVMGIGMALFEHTHYETTKGAPINSNLADYILPVNADVPNIEVHFLEYPNTELNEYGARGIGEIGLAGFAAATANAVYHATGIRVRDLPIRIEDLLGDLG